MINRVIIPLTGDERDRPLKAIEDNTRKIRGIQKAPIPSRSNRPPDKWAPTVPKRLWALPKWPATFQNSLSRGEYERRLPPRTTSQQQKNDPSDLFLEWMARFLQGAVTSWVFFVGGDDSFSFFSFLLAHTAIIVGMIRGLLSITL
jgi:hypothetical protein